METTKRKLTKEAKELFKERELFQRGYKAAKEEILEKIEELKYMLNDEEWKVDEIFSEGKK